MESGLKHCCPPPVGWWPLLTNYGWLICFRKACNLPETEAMLKKGRWDRWKIFWLCEVLQVACPYPKNWLTGWLCAIKSPIGRPYWELTSSIAIGATCSLFQPTNHLWHFMDWDSQAVNLLLKLLCVTCCTSSCFF